MVLLLAAATGQLSAQSPPPLLFERFPRHTAWGGGAGRAGVGDVDGDGYPDMAMSGPNAVRLMRNRGDGTFADTLLPVDLLGASQVAVGNLRFGDINGSGHLDLLVGATFVYMQPVVRLHQAILVFLGDGRGGFVQMPLGLLIPDIQHPAGVRTLALADVTGNGAPDLFVGMGQGQQSHLYLNDGRGFFRDATSTHLPVDLSYVTQAAFADLTGNGFPDLVLACGVEWPEVNRVYLNDGTGRLLNVVLLWPRMDQTESVAVGDVDGDGRADLVFGNFNTQDALYLNQGNGVFLDATDRLPREQHATWDLALGDINGNGHLDIVAATGATATGMGPLFYLNDGTGRFPTSSRDLARRVVSGHSVHLADFDGDGDLDLYVHNILQRWWLMNLTRHLYTQETVQLGAPLDLTFYGAQEQYFFPALSLAPARIPLTGLGTLGLDPGGMVVLPPVMIPRGERTASTQLLLPADPALQNRTLYSQALVVDVNSPSNTRLTNWLADLLR